jgi:hypothetical protein
MSLNYNFFFRDLLCFFDMKIKIYPLIFEMKVKYNKCMVICKVWSSNPGHHKKKMQYIINYYTKNDAVNYVQQRERGRGSTSQLVICFPWLTEDEVQRFTITYAVMCYILCVMCLIYVMILRHIYSPKGSFNSYRLAQCIFDDKVSEDRRNNHNFDKKIKRNIHKKRTDIEVDFYRQV